MCSCSFKHTHQHSQGMLSAPRAGPFALLNGGTARDALVISMPEGAELEAPLHVLHLTTGEHAQQLHSCLFEAPNSSRFYEFLAQFPHFRLSCFEADSPCACAWGILAVCFGVQFPLALRIWCFSFEHKVKRMLTRKYQESPSSNSSLLAWNPCSRSFWQHQ